MSTATLKDLAQSLNLSPSTVSRALRDHPDINPKTKERVIALAQKLDYHPDSIAQSLQNRKTKTIGIIVPEIKQPFFASVINGIEEVAYKAGYTIIVCQSNEAYDREVVYTQTLTSHRVAGLLVSLSQTTVNLDQVIHHIKGALIIIHHDFARVNILADPVEEDDRGTPPLQHFEVVNHLVQSGYRRIAHLAGPKNLSISKFRIKGYRDALNTGGLPFRKELVIHGGLDDTDGAIGFQKLLNLKKLPDAIFAVNDPVATGAYTTIRAQGLKIPNDIALAGFSNTNISALLEPALTTVEQPSYEMGFQYLQFGVEISVVIVDLLQQQSDSSLSHLIVREST